jgi:hypothetical protein
MVPSWSSGYIIFAIFCSLPNIIAEIAKEDEEKEKMHTRRTLAKEERLKSAPRRLGRHKYVPNMNLVGSHLFTVMFPHSGVWGHI